MARQIMGGSSVGASGLGNRGGGGGSGGGVEGGGSKTGGGVGDGSVDDGVGVSSSRGSVEVAMRGGLEEGARISRGASSSTARTVLVGVTGRSSMASGSKTVDEGVSRMNGASSCEVLSSKGRGVVLDVSVAITVRGGTETSGKVRMRAMLDRQKEECFILYSVP